MVPIGKRYEERATTLHEEVGARAHLHVSQAVAKAGNPVAVTRLNLRRRSGSLTPTTSRSA